MTGKFRLTVWDPILITSQILTIQALFYTSLAILIYVVDCIYVESPSLTHIFTYQIMTIKSGHNILIILSYLINAVCGSFYLWYFVGRAKPCLDYSATCYVVHLIVSWVYNGYFPNTWSWWILNVISASLMCIFGEYLCMQTEIKAIPLLSSGADV
ncbi:protein SYS1 homolog [Tetranychus urticae]|uniref:Protein SYS1 homolog n=1 Tax=Tetranychus urticae TaxID=32264 RepID=T1KP09_TETUR|nr:protein SYS1 homolog [Tetranychus urticae]